MCNSVSSYLSGPGVLTARSTNFSVLDRLGMATVRSVVRSILEGGNLRDVTEPMTRRRVLLSNAALLVMYFRMLGDDPDIENRLTSMVDCELSSSKRRLTSEKRELLLSLVGMTNKGWDNVVRRERGRISYLQRLDCSLKEIEQEVSREFGQFEAELTVDGVKRRFPTASLLRCMMAIGSQTLAIRGSEKSTYGKLFERLVLGSALTILGFKKVERDDIDESEMVFWLSDRKNKRECDATALITPGLCIRFDIGFIGRGNPEISLDKVTRYDHILELNSKGRHYEANSHTIIIVDTIGEGSRVREMAREIGGDIIQMNSCYWVKELAGIISRISGRNFKNPLARFTDEASLSFIADKICDVEFSRFLSAKHMARSAVTENVISVLAEVDEEFKFREYLPVWSFRVACGKNWRLQSADQLGWMKCEHFGGLDDTMFVVRAEGDSMRGLVEDGEYCVMRKLGGGSLRNKILLIQEYDAAGPDDGGAFALKKFTRKGKKVVLVSRNPDVADIVLEDEGEYSVKYRAIAEFKGKIRMEP